MEAKPFIDGRWSDGGRGQEVKSPGSSRVVTTVHEASPAEIEDAIRAATRAFRAAQKTPAHARARWLSDISQLIGSRAEELATCIANEVAKPIQLARGEVDRARQTFSIAAEEATRMGGEVLPLDVAPAGEGRFGIVRRFARGPVTAITPFNFPLNLAAHKIAPALACGASVIWKPAAEAPGTAALLAQIASTAGLPAGMLNVVPCGVAEAAPLVDDPRMRVLSFTGSAGVGWALRERCPRKQALLELGGDAFAIVEPDADLELAARRIALGAFAYAGQICISVQHVLVHQDVAREFRATLVAATRSIKVGEPLDPTAMIGPVIRTRDANRIMSWVDEALQGGARVVTGGERHGDVIEATVLESVPAGVRIDREEVFGPVVTLAEYGSLDDALARVNRSDFGLQASIFTNGVAAVMKAFGQLEVGAVIHNEWPLFRVDSMPYGGTKGSGWGREGLRYAMEEYTEPRMLVLSAT